MWQHCDEETKSRLDEEYKKNKVIYDKEKKATAEKSVEAQEDEEEEEKVTKKKKKSDPEFEDD